MNTIHQRLGDLQKLFTFLPSCPTIVTTDASGDGLGATLSQVQSGRDVPIVYASHTHASWMLRRHRWARSFSCRMGTWTLGVFSFRQQILTSLWLQAVEFDSSTYQSKKIRQIHPLAWPPVTLSPHFSVHLGFRQHCRRQPLQTAFSITCCWR